MIAPAPTKPDGKGGRHRLSADAVEFMQGYPPGWTDVAGVSRQGRLKGLGNAVVPQQAEAGVRALLEREATLA